MKKNITKVLATIVAIMLCGSLTAQTKISYTGDGHNNNLAPLSTGTMKSFADRGMKPIPHLPEGGTKSASVTVSAMPTAEGAMLTFTKNTDCYQYYVAVADTGLLEEIADLYASYGVSVTMEELMSQYVSQGTLCNSDTTITVTDLEPATSYSCYIWALASATDQTGVAIIGNGFVTTVDGGTGTATIAVSHAARALPPLRFHMRRRHSLYPTPSHAVRRPVISKWLFSTAQRWCATSGQQTALSYMPPAAATMGPARIH